VISESFRCLQNLKGPILVTGHTGFKGAWLSLLLEKLEIEHIGYSLPPENDSLISRIHNGAAIPGEFGDIRNRESLQNFFKKYNPSAVIHLAAQPLVLKSFDDPIETFETNVMGTANILQVASEFDSVQSIIVATTDKVYANNEDGRFFKETDPLMGKDPYSSSKVAAESAVDAWRGLAKVNNGPKIVSVRAGNVIGGGDWAANRLLPDAIRSFSGSEKLVVRNPNSVRPWQHVLDPLLGYLKVLSSSIKNENFDVRAVNFSPIGFGLSVREVVEVAQHAWQESTRLEIRETSGSAKTESSILNLDSNFAQQEFGWEPNWNQNEAVKSTVSWWRDHLLNGIDAKTLCKKNIDELIEN
jgi:CDP-glucose 4,6-dehydratase